MTYTMSVHDKIGVYKPKRAGAQRLTASGQTQELEALVPSKPSTPCVCSHCGIDFLVEPHRVNAKFCSTGCKYAAMRQPRVDCTCLACGTHFLRRQYDVNRGQGKFCSYACHNHGEHHPYWKGGRRPDDKGYIRVRVRGRGDVKEHRLVMEAHLGRRLSQDETVHHINGDKADNRIENLELMSHGEHTRRHNLTGGARYDRRK